MAWRRLCLEAERACDDAVIVREQPTEYAGQLVSLARRLSKPHMQHALGMANRSDLSTRVSALLDGSQRRGRVGLVAAVSAIAVASLVVLAIAPVRAVAQSVSSARRPAPLDRALYEAAEEGDLDAINALLNAGANVNCTIPGDGSPLIGAARKGRLEAVRLLLDRGANPNLSVRGDGNPLIMAARDGHVNVVALLLDRGALIDEIVPEDENALIQASERGRLEVVKVLVTRRANVNARAWAEPASERLNGEWRTPLSMARKGGHDAVVAFLLASGARD
jgi:ankyrin repeat protein